MVVCNGGLSALKAWRRGVRRCPVPLLRPLRLHQTVCRQRTFPSGKTLGVAYHLGCQGKRPHSSHRVSVRIRQPVISMSIPQEARGTV